MSDRTLQSSSDTQYSHHGRKEAKQGQAHHESKKWHDNRPKFHQPIDRAEVAPLLIKVHAFEQPITQSKFVKVYKSLVF
jgi:hypothetical protein